MQTDAALPPVLADALLGAAVRRSFDRISVDGQLSTNDTVILMASGASGVHVEPGSADELPFAQALDALLRQLAILIVADGEGARRIARVHVSGAGDETVSRVARAGAGVGFDAVALGQAVAGEEVLYEIALPGEGAEAELLFSDLSYDYVKINAEYTT